MNSLLNIASLCFMLFFVLSVISITFSDKSKDAECVQKNNDASVLLVIEGLRKAHPNASEICIVVAANIAVNNYDDVSHLMEAHGRCATKLLGLRVTKEDL